ncbi:MAG: GGDEF domain-containing protein [Georgfuchsia sp.]
MARQKALYYAQILMIVAEVFLISMLSYALGKYFPDNPERYISLDVLFCLPIIQTAKLSAIHTLRRFDSQSSIFVGIAVALVWSMAEAAIMWPDFPLNVLILNVFTRSVVLTVLSRVLLKLWREREYARMDMLTGLATRLELYEKLSLEQARSERSGNPYSLLYIDIDGFKILNDTHGHHVGDEALRLLADILRMSSRKIDVVARFGGDEFVLLLPDTDKHSCNTLIERIETFSKRAFEKRAWHITLSIGQVTNNGSGQTLDLLIRLADENMYEVKKMKQRKVHNA